MMTTRFSLIYDLKQSPWAESYLEKPPADWNIILDYLRRLWLIGEDTILETEFYEPFENPEAHS
jgi:hypothetical protein